MPPIIEKQDKRLHLLEIAETLFAEHGYEAVSIRKLAAKANVNVAMVSYYFGSKEKLFEALLETKMPRSSERLAALAQDDSLTHWEKISQVIDIYLDKFFSGHRFHRVIMREISLRQRPENIRLILTYMSRNMEIIGGIIRDAQEKGVFRYVDVELTVMSMFNMMSNFSSNTPLACYMLRAETESEVFSETNKARVKNHVKSMLQAHLVMGK